MNESARALLRQNRIFIIAIIFIAVSILTFAFMGVDAPVSAPSNQMKNIDLPSDKISAQDVWMEKMESATKLLEQKIKYLQDTIIESKKQEINASAREMTLQNEIVNLKNEMKTLGNNLQNTRSKVGDYTTSNQMGDPFAFQDCNQINEPEILVLRQPLREVIMPESREKIHHVDEMIPAGTTVKALLVSSLDAVCGVFSTSDPTPVKLRILDNGHLPKHVNVKLKGGILIGSAYGNISSERVYMRLERLTQVQPNGDFVETGVTGYVSGEDGKYGIRGVVVDKSTKAVANAAASGFLAGVSQSLQSALSKNRNIDSGNNYNFGLDIATRGGTQGSSTGLDMLAEYYIKRAEQIQPVIEVNAGRIVEVTFTLGVQTGDFHAKEVFKKIRQNNK